MSLLSQHAARVSALALTLGALAQAQDPYSANSSSGWRLWGGLQTLVAFAGLEAGASSTIWQHDSFSLELRGLYRYHHQAIRPTGADATKPPVIRNAFSADLLVSNGNFYVGPSAELLLATPDSSSSASLGVGGYLGYRDSFGNSGAGWYLEGGLIYPIEGGLFALPSLKTGVTYKF